MCLTCVLPYLLDLGTQLVGEVMRLLRSSGVMFWCFGGSRGVNVNLGVKLKRLWLECKTL